jgi:enoyl-CoA hydratase/carnithine racemase
MQKMSSFLLSSSVIKCRRLWCTSPAAVFVRRREWSHKTANNDHPENPEQQHRVRMHKEPNGIVHVILNRPEKLNALDISMFHALKKAAMDLSIDPSVRVVILRGEGRAFSTGLDVKSILRNKPIQTSRELLERHEQPIARFNSRSSNNHVDDDDDDNIQQLSLSESTAAETTNLAQDVGYAWRQLSVPVICVMHGMCFGGGLQIALGADIRYASSDCQISIMESKWGLIPDMSATVTLRELVRIDVAKELTMTGRIFSGIEAAQLGLVTRCIQNEDEDPLVAAQRLAEQLVEKSPDVLRLSKQLYQQTWKSGTTEEYCLRLETEFQKQLLLSWNQMAASARSLIGWKIPYFQKTKITTSLEKPITNT